METKQRSFNTYIFLAAAALFLGLLFNFLFVEHEIGLNFPLFAVIVVIIGLALAHLFGKRIDRKNLLILLLPALFFAFMVFVRSSELLTFFNAVGTVLLLLMAVCVFSGKNISSYVPEDYIKVILTPFRFIGSFFETLPQVFSVRKVSGTNTVAREVIRGSAMALGAVIVFAFLFALADDVFGKLLTDLLSFNLNEEFVARSMVVVFVSAFFIGAFGYMFQKHNPSPAAVPVEKERKLGAIEAMILLGAINVLFLFFIVLQLTYLFGGESHVITQGLTYAEYARKGFFELVVVAILSSIIIFAAEKMIVKKINAHLTSFKVLSGVLVLQVIFILVSAFARLSMYERMYGFSNIRLYSYAFMIWLAIVLVLLARHILTNEARERFAHHAFYAVIALLFFMNILNPDAFIARHNIDRYHTTGKLDTSYLANLSDDAVPVTVNLLELPDENIRKDFARHLQSVRERKNVDSSWVALQWSVIRAQKILESKQDQL